MPDLSRLSAHHFYDYLPAQTHHCGDIWTNLPTFGLLGKSHVSGVIITPACDLSNNKTETVTYLPIISIKAYFSSRAYLPRLKKRVTGHLKAGQFDPTIEWADHSFHPPSIQSIDLAIAAIEAHLSTKQRSTSEILALQRAISGLRLVADISSGGLGEAEESQLSLIFGSDWELLLRRFVKNSFSSDLHFLPCDGQEGSISGVPSHSVALFRYPITAPIEVLDLAKEASERTWGEIAAARENGLAAIHFYRERLPIKVLSLQSRFLADLLSRYVSVYSRIGSPDFTEASVNRMISEVRS